MPDRATDEDLELLEELGVDTAPVLTGGRTAAAVLRSRARGRFFQRSSRPTMFRRAAFTCFEANPIIPLLLRTGPWFTRLAWPATT